MQNTLFSRYSWVLSIAAGSLVAYLSYTLNIPAFILLLIVFWTYTDKKRDIFFLVFGYYAMIESYMPSALSKFNVPEVAPLFMAKVFLSTEGWVIVTAHAAILALFWIPLFRYRSHHMLMLIPLLALPPVGTLNIQNPLLMAGELFPGTGLLGILLTYWLIVWVVKTCDIMLIVGNPVLYLARGPLLLFVFLFALTNVNYAAPSAPDGWIAIDTDFGGYVGRDKISVEERNRVLVRKAREAKAKGYRVMVFPEEVEQYWTAGNQKLWQGKSMEDILPLVGTNIEKSKGLFLDAAVDARSGKMIARSRVPMPVGNWTLWGDGAESHVLATNVKALAGRRAAMIFCYEDLIVYPLMFDSFEHPDVIVSMANTWSTNNTPAQTMQKESIEWQARLYHLPLVRAENI